MKYTVKDPKYLSLHNTTLEYISRCSSKKIIEGLMYNPHEYSQVIPEETEFTVVKGSEECVRGHPYVVLENNALGMFLCRSDNLKIKKDRESILFNEGVSKIFRSADTTVLIDSWGRRYITKYDGEGEYDLEKAVMLLMLKRNGYTAQDIYDLVGCVEDKN